MAGGTNPGKRRPGCLALTIRAERVAYVYIQCIRSLGVDLEEYLDTVIFNHPRDFTREDFKNFMFKQSKELPDMLKWLKEWKKDCGFRIIAINNEGKELNDYRVKKFKLHEYLTPLCHHVR
jgi:FMN phosphatase YigB (HAD superfamily)